jgi:hypothetical protein
MTDRTQRLIAIKVNADHPAVMAPVPRYPQNAEVRSLASGRPRSVRPVEACGYTFGTKEALGARGASAITRGRTSDGSDGTGWALTVIVPTCLLRHHCAARPVSEPPRPRVRLRVSLDGPTR